MGSLLLRLPHVPAALRASAPSSAWLCTRDRPWRVSLPRFGGSSRVGILYRKLGVLHHELASSIAGSGEVLYPHAAHIVHRQRVGALMDAASNASSAPCAACPEHPLPKMATHPLKHNHPPWMLPKGQLMETDVSGKH